jgi:cell division protein FtsW
VRRGLESSVLILVTLGLVAFGLVMVYSATSASAALANGDPAYYLKRQAVYAGLGLVLMVVLSRVDFYKLRALAPTLIVASIGLLLAVLVLGRAANGARRWISIGPAAFQPSELAKLALAVWAASYLARRRAPRTLGELWRPIGVLTMVFCGLILVEPDLGTAIAIVTMLAAILLVSGTPTRTLAGGLGIAATLGLFAVWFEPYRRARLFSFLNPGRTRRARLPDRQAMIGLGSGGIFGVGLGQSVQKANYLPEAHTDMIFAIIGEELGLVGATGGDRSPTAPSPTRAEDRARLQGPVRQAARGRADGARLRPGGDQPRGRDGPRAADRIPLPFVSYGGSSLVVALACVGILLNIAGNAGARSASVPDRSRRDGGHVLPALAVADALQARGARVTFAGSPDRAEARLVPDAGYELDTFRVSGLPRQPGLAQARAVLHGLAAPAACDRILARRGPNAVLGAAGYVGGPMVVAAARRRIRPRSRRPMRTSAWRTGSRCRSRNASSSRSRSQAATRRSTSSPAARSRRARGPLPREEARRRLDLPADGPVLLVAGAAPARGR